MSTKKSIFIMFFLWLFVAMTTGNASARSLNSAPGRPNLRWLAILFHRIVKPTLTSPLIKLRITPPHQLMQT